MSLLRVDQWKVKKNVHGRIDITAAGSLSVSSTLPFPDSNQKLVKRYIQFRTYSSSSSDLLCCNVLAKAMTSVAVRLLCLRLYWKNRVPWLLGTVTILKQFRFVSILLRSQTSQDGLKYRYITECVLQAHVAQFFTIMVPCFTFKLLTQNSIAISRFTARPS